jgi:lipopolysaccharide biosynthesis regulator YciM
MKLAETYLEMGMTDEAFAALRTAARSPRQRFQAGSILGRLYRERGDPMQAIEWMERAAEAPAPTTDEGRALLYDLGETLEAVGETARALAVFLELQADAGEYRDVAARVDHLSRVQTGG